MRMASDGTALTELCLEDWWWARSRNDDDYEAAIVDATVASNPDGATITDDAQDTVAITATERRAPDGAREIFRQTSAWLKAYFTGERPDFGSAPPLHAQGTPFQHEVWDLIAEIPYGQTVSYGDIATELAERRGGGRMAAQAVGGAVKRNPITIIVPCHRVVGSGRSFGGYGGRLDIKATLLNLEGVDLSRFDL
ncbi:methylated-DNA--[protein]-cysteine S-methyltransferase [Bifidobacterium sp. 82T25]|nr:methylated-DNA--[protein]-cysteine S-methyltransferase [Bifidobacterium miconisargentati]MBW3090807.1 methylated-DNA--[protein]-cysteine S-methyltransferase [Bifidobacterium miconisargentati]